MLNDQQLTKSMAHHVSLTREAAEVAARATEPAQMGLAFSGAPHRGDRTQDKTMDHAHGYFFLRCLASCMQVCHGDNPCGTLTVHYVVRPYCECRLWSKRTFPVKRYEPWDI